ncbi:MAG: cysteine--tRNA ligase [Proteobacteria bacterium]|nr:MAG: cysteine--tRNA ligase [Pseudomonadota bacterium]
MSLILYNTLSRRKEPFVPSDPERVTMYVCGPTVYNFVHIGNARPVVIFDVLYRLLREEFPHVVYARNITDVDDKINQAAAENGESIAEVAARFAKAFHDDIASLNTLPPDIEPRATGHIEQMISMIERLIANGNAYEAQGHVLFDVASMPDYGRLSGRNRDDMIAGARVEVAPYKRDPADFVLWKPSTAELPGWDSPWGRGRPGWHLECSAMIETHLGETIDIHGGGQDLIFPHHENELAQSVCSHGGKPYVRYWVHNGYITVSGEKMSKSLGNFFTLRELLDMAPGEAIRYALLSGHYRKPLDWSPDALEQARASLDRLYKALERCEDVEVDADTRPPQSVMDALEDDLNSPRALSELHALAGSLNNAVTVVEKKTGKARLLAAGAFLGLLRMTPTEWFRWTPEGVDGLAEQEIESLVEQRRAARAARDFAEADRIRDHLLAEGVSLEDTRDGTLWHRVASVRE